MNVLSLFDGMSCGQMALDRAGIHVDNYYAAEIDKYAIQVTQNNYPDTIQLGSVTEWQQWDLPKIDLILAGSPCQGFSVAGKQLAFDDPRSSLYFIFEKILKHHEPKFFLLENVVMAQEHNDVISSRLGELYPECIDQKELFRSGRLEPVQINSSLVSAQNRERLYWTNIPNIEPPADRGILLKDIVHENIECIKNKSNAITANYGNNSPEDYFKKSRGQMVLDCGFDSINVNPSGKGMNGLCKSADNAKAGTVTTNKGEGSKIALPLNSYIVPFEKSLKILDKEVEKGKVGYFRKDCQANRVYFIHNKAVTLCGEAGGGAAKMGQYLFGVITPDRLNKRQNGQRFSSGRKFYTLTAQDQHGILIEGYIRKLTPIECERLQTVRDNYTAGVSNSQRYKMLGNGWTVEVIVDILLGIIPTTTEEQR